METKSYKNWWFLGLNGLLISLFGLMLLFSTPEFFLKMMLFLGIILSASGAVLFLLSVYSLKKEKLSGMTILQAIISLTIGIIIIISPKEDLLTYFFLMAGVWITIIGIFQIAVMVNIRKSISNKNILLLNGFLTIGLGLFLCFKPFEFTDLWVRLMGIMALLLGAVLVYFSFMIRYGGPAKILPQEKTKE